VPSKVFEDMISTGQPSMASVPGILPLQPVAQSMERTEYLPPYFQKQEICHEFQK